MSKKIKLLKQVGEIPAGTVGLSWGVTRATGGLTLRFDRPGHTPEVLTNVNAELVEFLDEPNWRHNHGQR